MSHFSYKTIYLLVQLSGFVLLSLETSWRMGLAIFLISEYLFSGVKNMFVSYLTQRQEMEIKFLEKQIETLGKEENAYQSNLKGSRHPH